MDHKLDNRLKTKKQMEAVRINGVKDGRGAVGFIFFESEEARINIMLKYQNWFIFIFLRGTVLLMGAPCESERLRQDASNCTAAHDHYFQMVRKSG